MQKKTRKLHIDKNLAIEYGAKRNRDKTKIYNKSKINTLEVSDGEDTITLAPEEVGELSHKHSAFTYKIVKVEGGTGNSYLDSLKGIE